MQRTRPHHRRTRLRLAQVPSVPLATRTNDVFPLLPNLTASGTATINDQGWIVRTCSLGVTDHGCLWVNGKRIDLGYLGTADGRETGVNGWDINERGQIVGTSQHFMDTSHAVLWTPQPARWFATSSSAGAPMSVSTRHGSVG